MCLQQRYDYAEENLCLQRLLFHSSGVLIELVLLVEKLD